MIKSANRCINCKRPHHGEVGTSDWALYESAKGRNGIICPDCMSPEARAMANLNGALLDVATQGFGLGSRLQRGIPVKKGTAFYGTAQ